jgi:lysophospholipase L1-like esterase
MNILFLGDSLIEYFDWQARFPGHRIGNFGIAGESVQGLLSRVMNIKESFSDAGMAIVMSGINNIAMGDDDFIRFYRLVIERLQSSYPEAHIMACSLLPVNMDFISNDTIIRVNKALYELVKETGIEWLNIFERFIDTRGGVITEYLLEDGVHVSNEGYAVWSKAVDEIINKFQI